MPWTPPELVSDTWLGPDAPTDLELVTAWVGRAERLIRRRVPDIEERLAADNSGDLLETVRDVVCAAVARAFRNPEGVRQRQETVGQFAGSVTYSGSTPGALEILPDEMAALTAGASGARRAGSVDMIPPESPYATGGAWALDGWTSWPG